MKQKVIFQRVFLIEGITCSRAVAKALPKEIPRVCWTRHPALPTLVDRGLRGSPMGTIELCGSRWGPPSVTEWETVNLTLNRSFKRCREKAVSTATAAPPSTFLRGQPGCPAPQRQRLPLISCHYAGDPNGQHDQQAVSGRKDGDALGTWPHGHVKGCAFSFTWIKMKLRQGEDARPEYLPFDNHG